MISFILTLVPTGHCVFQENPKWFISLNISDMCAKCTVQYSVPFFQSGKKRGDLENLTVGKKSEEPLTLLIKLYNYLPSASDGREEVHVC